MAAEFRKASRIFNKFLRVTLGNYMRLLFDFRILNEEIAGLKPPYIVLANHTNFWDPFLLSMCFKDPVYFVTSDIHFRNPVLRWLLKYVGAIAKTKNVSDPRTIKDIIKVSRIGGIIGIFPEGQRSWDGKTLPLYSSTAKLVKSLKLPVVTVIFKGGYLSMPRWAGSSRRGRVDMICRRLLAPEELTGLTADEIYQRLTEGLKHNEYEFQKKEMLRYKSRKPAERLELFLFCCPECNSIGSMKSSNSDFNCTACGYTVKYNEYGFFDAADGKPHYDNPRDWNQWQLTYLELLMKDTLDKNSLLPLFSDDILLMSGTGERHQPLNEGQTGRLTLLDDAIRFEGHDGLSLRIPLKDITGENVQMNNLLEFYYDKTLYRVKDSENRVSAYKWQKAIEIYKGLSKDTNIFHLEG